MLVIGITGQTGAGKSTLVSLLGFEAIDADQTAREIMSDKEVLHNLCAAFGQDILNADGTLDRRKLAFRAFENSQTVGRLNQITHPAIMKRIIRRIDAYEKSGQTLILLDAPQLYESGADKLCAKVIAVVAPEDLRQRRIIDRDNLSAELAEKRLGVQKPNSYYGRADFLIVNDGDTALLKTQAEKLKHILIKLTEE